MVRIETKYGTIESDGLVDYDRAGNVRSVIASSRCSLATQYGIMIPNYTAGEPRKKYRSSVGLYEDGSLESIYLEEPIELNTSIGKMEAELITFYEGERIKRIFPRYGQINGYWSEEDEYNLFPEIEIEITGYRQKCKALSIEFYDNGALKGITIWNRTPVTVKTSLGDIKTDFGFQLYKDGRLKSIEPMFGTKLHTSYGELCPSNPEHNPFHAEHNSLLFWPDGSLRLVKTILNDVEIAKGNGKIEIVKPRAETDLFDQDILVKKALEIEFFPYTILIRRGDGITHYANKADGDKIRIGISY